MKQAKITYYDKYGESLKNYVVFKQKERINVQAIFLIVLFLTATVYYALELLAMVESTIFNPQFYAAIFAFAFVGPMIYIARKRKKFVVFTERGLIRREGFKKSQYIAFDEISKVATDHERTLILISEDHKLMFDYTKFDEDFKKVNEILQYRGFFKEDPEEYTVSIANGVIVVEQKKVSMDEDTAQLFERFIKKYQFLTPGFMEDLIFYNIQIDRIQLTEAKHVIFYLTHLDVKPTHPENTSFQSQKTDEAMVVFENINNVSIYSIDEKGHREKIGSDIQTMRETTKKAIIFEADYDAGRDANRIEFIMSHASKKQRVRFNFTQTIAGWNTFKEPSWFEK